ncbi:protein unc-45A [Sesamum alatum]|uniref:Protein unc-45A n=1 Tax=Sesamum alatum TaxID=300844 RepID=A0AAE1XZR2_9LAMI|nr:protein unc-45A [Sesamum alatum]
MASGSATMNRIERAHQMYREGKYAEALDYYTEALSMAKTKPQKIALHSNRAACYLKLHDFDKAAKECTSVLELDHNHTGALMLRAQTLVTLKEYHSALFDVNRLMELNPSSEVYRNLQARLKTQLSLATIPEDEAELEEDDEHIDKEKLEENEGEKEESKEVEKFGSQENYVNGNAAIAQNKESKSGNISSITEIVTSQNQTTQKALVQKSLGWQTIPKPKGHSYLDYSRWDRVEDVSSEEEDDDDDGSQPQYRFRVKTVGVRAVK